MATPKRPATAVTVPKNSKVTPITDAPSAQNGAVPMPATRDAAVKGLFERGKLRGSLTYEEVATVSAAFDEDDPDKGNELVEELMAQGIEITDVPDTVIVEKDDVVEPEEVDLTSVSAGMSLDDPVRMYLKEIGRVPLLGMAQEQDLAKAIERASDELERARTKGVNASMAIVDAGDTAKRDLTEANLRETDLQEANLQEADLRHADLRNANLSGANLWRANLRGADLRNANLSHANLEGAELDGTDFRGADLQDTNMAKALLQTAVFDEIPAISEADAQARKQEQVAGLHLPAA